MKFDCIIMNPPYNKNLHLKILAEAIAHLKDENSKCVNLSPIRWAQVMHTDENKFKWLDNKISSLKVIPSIDVTKAFGVCSNDLAIYDIQNDGKGKSFADIDRFTLNSKLNGHFEEAKSIFKKIMAKMPDNLKNHAVYKPFENYSVLTAMLIMATGGGGDGVHPTFLVNNLHNGVYKGNVFMDDGKTFSERRGKGGPKSKDGIKKDKQFNNHVEFNTFEEADNFRKSMRTTFMLFIDCLTRMDVNVHSEYYPYMNDYTHPWTDEDFYKYFDITSEEQKVIEETMEKYK